MEEKTVLYVLAGSLIGYEAERMYRKACWMEPRGGAGAILGGLFGVFVAKHPDEAMAALTILAKHHDQPRKEETKKKSLWDRIRRK